MLQLKVRIEVNEGIELTDSNIINMIEGGRYLYVVHSIGIFGTLAECFADYESNALDISARSMPELFTWSYTW